MNNETPPTHTDVAPTEISGSLNARIEANLRRQIEILEETVALQKKQLEAHEQPFSSGLSDHEIEELMHQEPINENETALAKCRRIMEEQD